MKNHILILLILISLTSGRLFGQAEDPNLLGNAPIAFYGKVVDENNNPLADVHVHVSVIVNYLVALAHSDQRVDPLDLKTDSEGAFKIENVSGSSIQLDEIKKDGYKLSPKVGKPTFSYYPVKVHHDPAQPDVFKMWKTGTIEHLITGEKLYKLIPDGRPYTIDLLEQTKQEGVKKVGDLVVRIKRPLDLKPRKRFDWSYSIEAIDGGILHSDDEFLYRAPEAGYQPTYDFGMSATNAHRYFGQQFYFKSRSGKMYGSFTVEIIPDYNNSSAFRIDYTINPSGSRNLER